MKFINDNRMYADNAPMNPTTTAIAESTRTRRSVLKSARFSLTRSVVPLSAVIAGAVKFDCIKEGAEYIVMRYMSTLPTYGVRRQSGAATALWLCFPAGLPSKHVSRSALVLRRFSLPCG